MNMHASSTEKNPLQDSASAERSLGRKVVYVINERNGKSYWTRIGFGSTNKDGSMNLRFDAIPTSGTVQVRDWEPRDETSSSGSTASSAPAGNGAGAARASFA